MKVGIKGMFGCPLQPAKPTCGAPKSVAAKFENRHLKPLVWQAKSLWRT
jgi:hypothetical protein